MFVYQLVGGMGTTLWCKNFFFSMLVVEVKWESMRARTLLYITSVGPRKKFFFQ